ncbi:hypothetical protein SeMB42_g07084 [Synchytrium endobioticum]|uniref:tRNA (guanine(37)-N1)-methyltransferase n=1 Tax=Synchytrium endobioticum TaxID=286115 RepID=A0A507C4F2_9FUNG|nr:hypothetical protein SeMB42_g07084 [Synchytrium endobioticum]TPX39038.1 hypothetical protein SeLEV6574_g07448 [Synchytrium endobioticum]
MPLTPPSLPNTTILNKDLFACIVNVTALRIPAQQTHKLVASLKGFLLRESRIKPVVDIPNHPKERLVLLDPDVAKEPNLETLSNQLQELIQKAGASVTPYQLHLTYDSWSFDQIIRSVLPSTLEVPSSFESVGHIAHFNLRDEYLPYRHLLGQVLLDKASHLRTVVHKLDSIDHTFRFFKMEVLAGEEDFMAEVHESNCRFKFDFSKVYWNSRLQMEHARLLRFFKPGESICDAFAGVGPFAIPAAKNQQHTVFANDLNPNSYHALVENVKLNKVEDKVATYNMDARDFFTIALRDLNDAQVQKSMAAKVKPCNTRSSKKRKQPNGISISVPSVNDGPVKQWFNHYIMNLPAAAVDFLDVFAGLLSDFTNTIPHDKLPVIHCYCFTKGQEEAEQDAINLVSKHLGADLSTSDLIDVHRVRDVSPKKEMFCVSFRLPPSVAFAKGLDV